MYCTMTRAQHVAPPTTSIIYPMYCTMTRAQHVAPPTTSIIYPMYCTMTRAQHVAPPTTTIIYPMYCTMARAQHVATVPRYVHTSCNGQTARNFPSDKIPNFPSLLAVLQQAQATALNFFIIFNVLQKCSKISFGKRHVCDPFCISVVIVAV